MYNKLNINCIRYQAQPLMRCLHFDGKKNMHSCRLCGETSVTSSFPEILAFSLPQLVFFTFIFYITPILGFLDWRFFIKIFTCKMEVQIDFFGKILPTRNIVIFKNVFVGNSSASSCRRRWGIKYPLKFAKSPVCLKNFFFYRGGGGMTSRTSFFRYDPSPWRFIIILLTSLVILGDCYFTYLPARRY